MNKVCNFDEISDTNFSDRWKFLFHIQFKGHVHGAIFSLFKGLWLTNLGEKFYPQSSNYKSECSQDKDYDLRKPLTGGYC